MLPKSRRGLSILSLFLLLLLGAAPLLSAEEPQARKILIESNDQMKFSVEAFEVAPGAVVELTLKNVGRLPKEAMGHNLVILGVGVDARKYVLAATSHAEDDYRDPALADQVIAATKMLGPHERDTITFTAPATVGDFEYVCSFPGHLALGMKGVMKVR